MISTNNKGELLLRIPYAQAWASVAMFSHSIFKHIQFTRGDEKQGLFAQEKTCGNAAHLTESARTCGSINCSCWDWYVLPMEGEGTFIRAFRAQRAPEVPLHMAPLGLRGLQSLSASWACINLSAPASPHLLPTYHQCSHMHCHHGRDGRLFCINHLSVGRSLSLPTRLPILMSTPVHLEPEWKQPLIS